MLADKLDHLPDIKRRELERVVKILFDEFEDATKMALSDKRKAGRILKIILFGSYARGDWVEDRSSGYRSDYDLLVIVNGQAFTDLHDYWAKADEHLMREYTVTQHIRTPANFIVHSLDDVNDNLARGRPFFVDIARDGIMLYEAEGYPLARSKGLRPEDVWAEAQANYRHWHKLIDDALDLAAFGLSKDKTRDGAFMLHQATERAYHCVLLVLTLYSPKSHRLSILRSQAESLDETLRPIWPDDSKFARRCFARLQRAYVDARYSTEYEITHEELNWITERVRLLQEAVTSVCQTYLDGPPRQLP